MVHNSTTMAPILVNVNVAQGGTSTQPEELPVYIPILIATILLTLTLGIVMLAKNRWNKQRR